MSNLPIVYKVKEVAEIFRISTRRLRHLINSGAIKTISLGPRHEVIPRSEIEKFLGQDLRYVDLSGFGFSPRKKEGIESKSRVRWIK